MSNDSPAARWTQPTAANTPGADHPSGDIRLPGQSSVGHRARLLAGADAPYDDGSTVVETTCSMSWV